jgi:glycine/D-amino acid oxidase-like deaminating enzyme
VLLEGIEELRYGGRGLMRVGIIGGGLAGSLLAWRLAGQPAVTAVLLAPGAPRAADATAASGGAVRAYEVSPEQRALALASMAELADDPVLRDWSGFVGCGSVYLPAEPRALAEAVDEINGTLGGSASIVDAAQLRNAGWSGLAENRVGISERQAGYLDPARFRGSLLADLAGRSRVSVLPHGPVEAFSADGFTLAGDRYHCDLLVLATGAWTPGLLSAAGYPATGLTTKSIQYTIHRATGMLATTFVDDASGLFGKPHSGGLLLGLPTSGWGAPASGVAADRALADRAAAMATEAFPALRLHSAEPPVAAIDCYAESGLLALRPVAGGDGRLFTFTGGSGSSAKSALAASRQAATGLLAMPADGPAAAAPVPVVGGTAGRG